MCSVLPGCLYCHALILQKQNFKAISGSVCCDHEAMNLNGSKGEVGWVLGMKNSPLELGDTNEGRPMVQDHHIQVSDGLDLDEALPGKDQPELMV